MIVEALSQLVAGNLSWFVDIVMNNLHWTFALLAFVVITLTEVGVKKNHLRNFIFLVGFLYAFSSLADLTGLVLISAGIFLIFQLVILIFWHDSWAKKHPLAQLSFIVFLFLLLSMLVTFGII